MTASRHKPFDFTVAEALRRQAVTLTGRAGELSAALGKHLQHEEDSALPLIQSVLTPAEQHQFLDQLPPLSG